jgi:hypothetical protein
MTWLAAFGALHRQLSNVHPLATLSVAVDQQTMISIVLELNRSVPENRQVDPFTIREMKLFGIKISLEEQSAPSTAPDPNFHLSDWVVEPITPDRVSSP